MSTPDFRALCAELLAAADEYAGMNPYMRLDNAMKAARAALAAEPVGEGPSDEELIQLAIDTRLYRFQATAGDPVQYEMTEQQVHAFARAVLSRWGGGAAPPAPVVPVAVAERLPGEGDCDAEGRCWWFSAPACGPHKIRPCWTLDSEAMEGDTHWRPFHAIPLPQAADG
jgi:hypothetical protein